MTRAALALVVALTVAAPAIASPRADLACVCVEAPLAERLDRADAAVVGRVVRAVERRRSDSPELLLTVEVDQRVKAGVERTLLVRSPLDTDCDLRLELDRAVGLLLERSRDGTWRADACSVVEPGPLVMVGGEPRGGPIKVAIGAVILALVLALAFYRLKRGSRPDLPGAPRAPRR